MVTTAARLQQEVADPSNAGRRIVLQHGNYTLSPDGPTGGRLELQTDMELEGVPGDSGAVVIDASELPPASYQLPALTGALRMGRGHNAVRWLTLRNAAPGSAFVETDLAPTVADAETSVTVEGCIIEGNARGIDFRLLGAAASGRSLRATFKDNVFRDNTAGKGQGLRIAHLQGVTGATLLATVQGNSVDGNLAGLLAASNNSSGNTIAIDSRSNTYSGNGVGVVLVAGIAAGTSQANDNKLTFDSSDDAFEDNNLPTAAYTDAGAGLVAQGADSIAPVAGRANRNSHVLILRNPRFSGNLTFDLLAIGARGVGALVPGTDNELLAVLLGGTGTPIVQETDSAPAEPTNHATVVQHPGH
jgi:hypothetical protein